MYIAISGNIGSGKTSLVEMLSSRLGYEPFFERIDNPYLDSFYQDMARWSFNLQMSFLSKKTLQVKEIMDSKNDIIQDRTIFEEAYVFVRNLNRMGLMSTQDYELYMTFFDLLAAGIRRPDIIVYLKASIPKPDKTSRTRIRDGHTARIPRGTQRAVRRLDSRIRRTCHNRGRRPIRLRA